MTAVLTVVSGIVAADRADELVAAYEALVAESLPDGLLQSSLLRGGDGEWRIATLWRDVGALAAMRSTSETPPALALFRSVGVEPTVARFDVMAHAEAG